MLSVAIEIQPRLKAYGPNFSWSTRPVCFFVKVSSIYLSVCISLSLSLSSVFINLSVCLSIHLSVYL